jgi:ATP-dependent DNA ligase
MNKTVIRTNDKGQTTQWRAWVEEDNEGQALLCTESGVVGGKLRTSRRVIREAGREDTCLDKARQQATKKTDDKINKEGYALIPSKNTKRKRTATTAAEEAAETKKLRVTSDKDDDPIPMRARPLKIDMVHKMKLPMAAQKKIDGFRCIVSFETKNEVTLLSRTRALFKGFPTLKAQLKELHARLPTQEFGSGRFYLDGELFIPNLDFSELSSQLKRGQNRFDYDPPNIQYRIFDCFDRDYPDHPFSERYAFVQQFYPVDDTAVIHVLNNVLAETEEDVFRLLREFIAGGDEGVILRALHGLYEYRKQSQYMYKFKQMEDDEFIIVGYKEGEGSREGTVVWECQANTSEETFYVSPVGTHEHRAQLFQDAERYIGYLLTVGYQEIQESGCPRFPTGKGLRPGFDLDKVALPQPKRKCG